MSTAEIVLRDNLSFNELKKQYGSLIDEIDGADASHGENHVEVEFTDGSSVIYNDEYPSTQFN